MRFHIMTLFPEIFNSYMNESIMKKAVEKNIIEVNIYNIRDFSTNKHKKVDDYPFGGGAGMVMTPQPIYSAIMAVDPNQEARRIFMSPKGRTFCQPMVKELLSYERILLLCGHYEGVDQRVIDLMIDEEISLGDFVLTGGEIPAMAITDSLCRYVGGVISNESLSEESFTGNLLEYPQFTRPQVFMGLQVPEVLVSGNHKEVDKWRRAEAEKITQKLRPDLLGREE